MYAARDQENLVHGLHQAAAAKPLNQSTRALLPKTPGNKFPKTPLKIPLNDENARVGFGGRPGKGKAPDGLMTSKKGATFDKSAFVTPLGPRTRAPLGMKTTNAKAKACPTPAGPATEKEVEKTQPKRQTSARRPKKLVHADPVKMAVHGDESPLAERDVEYCPPKLQDRAYESSDFPDNCLDYTALRPENLKKGISRAYRHLVDENGLSRIEREAEEGYQRSARECDTAVLKMMEEDWTVGDVPETFRPQRNKTKPSLPQVVPPTASRKPPSDVKKPHSQSLKGPGTLVSKRAASALALPSQPAALPAKTSKPPVPKLPFLSSRPKPTPAPSNASTMRQAVAVAASRSTIGYTKGRSASAGILSHKASSGPPAAPRAERTLQRSVSTASSASTASDVTITPARFFARESELELEREWRQPSFLKAFEQLDDNGEEGEGEEEEGRLGGALAECLRREDEEDEGFVMKLGGGGDEHGGA